jgi:hypothetical protein
MLNVPNIHEELRRRGYEFKKIRWGNEHWYLEFYDHTVITRSRSRSEKEKKSESEKSSPGLMTELAEEHGDILEHQFDTNLDLGLGSGDAFLFQDGTILFFEEETGQRYVLKPTATVDRGRGTHQYRTYDPEGNRINEIGVYSVGGTATVENTTVTVDLDQVFDHDTNDGQRTDTGTGENR